MKNVRRDLFFRRYVPLPLVELPLGELPLVELPFGELPLGELPFVRAWRGGALALCSLAALCPL